MVDKKKMGNLLIGMRLALGQPLTSALPTASGTMLLNGLLSKAPMRSRFIACLHSHASIRKLFASDRGLFANENDGDKTSSAPSAFLSSCGSNAWVGARAAFPAKE